MIGIKNREGEKGKKWRGEMGKGRKRGLGVRRRREKEEERLE